MTRLFDSDNRQGWARYFVKILDTRYYVHLVSSAPDQVLCIFYHYCKRKVSSEGILSTHAWQKSMLRYLTSYKLLFFTNVHTYTPGIHLVHTPTYVHTCVFAIHFVFALHEMDLHTLSTTSTYTVTSCLVGLYLLSFTTATKQTYHT